VLSAKISTGVFHSIHSYKHSIKILLLPVAPQVSYASTLINESVINERKRSENDRLVAPIHTPSSSSSETPLTPGSSPEILIFVLSDDENEGTPSNQNQFVTRTTRSSSVKNSKLH
jgi:hypothetical protein